MDSIRESKVSDLSFERKIFKICLQRHPGYGCAMGEILFQQLQIQNANPTQGYTGGGIFNEMKVTFPR